MERLWAPWRSRYINLGKPKGCIFCGNRKAGNTETRFIIERTAHSFSMLNLYPYNNGHVMVAPFRHAKSLELLTDTELLDLMKLVTKTKASIDKKLKPHGYNIGLNVGKIGGAGYDGHLHVHIVPRWTGDTNFMPVVGDTKIVSDSLKAMYKKLKGR